MNLNYLHQISDRQHRCERGPGGDRRGGGEGPLGQGQGPPGFGAKEEDNFWDRDRHHLAHRPPCRSGRHRTDLMGDGLSCQNHLRDRCFPLPAIDG